MKGAMDLAGLQTFTLISRRRRIVLGVSTIVYVRAFGKQVEIHVTGGQVYETRMSMRDIAQALGEGFIRIDRGCLVSAIAIDDVTDCVKLAGGEELQYAARRKSEIIARLQRERKHAAERFARDGEPSTPEEYRRHYAAFDGMPFAFADIEMVFDTGQRAVDWIFRYGNPALARMEKMPLERLIGASFGSLFSNMSDKWLRLYERAALRGETLEIVEYSPEVDATLKITCFPTFRGHCGCILWDIGQIEQLCTGQAEAAHDRRSNTTPL